MNKCLLLLFLIGLGFVTKAQTNLVTDGSFEDCIPNQFGSYFFLNLAHWKNPNNLSPDYCTDLDNAYRPSYSYDDYQVPKEGNGFAALVVIQKDYPDIAREYAQGKLITPLLSGKKYQVKFYTSRSNRFGCSIATIGAYISNQPFTFSYRCELEPHIENKNHLTDTINWMEVNGEYIALGGEQYITLGNFRTDVRSDTAHFIVPFSNPSSSLTAYYFIDDVSVICLDCSIDEVGVGIVEQNKNPKNIVFNTSTNALNVSEWGTLVIYNMQGAKVKELLVKSGEVVSVSAEGLGRAGVYIWQFKTEKEVQQGKFVVE